MHVFQTTVIRNSFSVVSFCYIKLMLSRTVHSRKTNSVTVQKQFIFLCKSDWQVHEWQQIDRQTKKTAIGFLLFPPITPAFPFVFHLCVVKWILRTRIWSARYVLYIIYNCMLYQLLSVNIPSHVQIQNHSRLSHFLPNSVQVKNHYRFVFSLSTFPAEIIDNGYKIYKL